jgi:hypothetical protein
VISVTGLCEHRDACDWSNAVQGLANIATRQQAMLSVLQVERETLIRLRDEDQIDDEVMRVVQRELDLTESRMHSGSFLLH